MLAKVDVKGENICPLYSCLASQAANAEIKWNFAKFLVNKDGEVVKFYAHGADPMSMMSDIEGLLNQ